MLLISKCTVCVSTQYDLCSSCMETHMKDSVCVYIHTHIYLCTCMDDECLCKQNVYTGAIQWRDKEFNTL